MAQFFTDFSGYAADTQPSDWTERWNTGNGSGTVRTSGIPSGAGVSAALQVSMSSNARYAISWDAVGTVSGDVQVLSLGYYEGSAASSVLRTLLHGAGTAGNESAYFANMDFDGFGSFPPDTMLQKYVNGGGGNLEDLRVGLSENQWIWVRLDRSSNTIRLKAWEYGTSEPGSWTLSTSDSSLSSGWVGLGTFRGTGNWFAQIGVGTGGDTAPSEAPITDVDTSIAGTIQGGITSTDIEKTEHPVTDVSGTLRGGIAGTHIEAELATDIAHTIQGGISESLVEASLSTELSGTIQGGITATRIFEVPHYPLRSDPLQTRRHRGDVTTEPGLRGSLGVRRYRGEPE